MADHGSLTSAGLVVLGTKTETMALKERTTIVNPQRPALTS
jgi:hypothetical protein